MRKIELDDGQQMSLLRRWSEGDKARDIGKDLAMSERTVFNVLGQFGVHRCRCGDLHVKGGPANVWARSDGPHGLRAGQPGRLVDIAGFRIVIQWEGAGREVLDADAAGGLFTFRRPRG